MRRSELASLDFNDVTIDGDRIIVEFFGSKVQGNLERTTRYITDLVMVNYIKQYMSRFQYEVEFILYL